MLKQGGIKKEKSIKKVLRKFYAVYKLVGGLKFIAKFLMKKHALLQNQGTIALG